MKLTMMIVVMIMVDQPGEFHSNKITPSARV